MITEGHKKNHVSTASNSLILRIGFGRFIDTEMETNVDRMGLDFNVDRMLLE